MFSGEGQVLKMYSNPENNYQFAADLAEDIRRAAVQPDEEMRREAYDFKLFKK